MSVIVAVLASVVWLKGNLHTHTLESDGDSTPQEVAAWYREQLERQDGLDAVCICRTLTVEQPATFVSAQ